MDFVDMTLYERAHSSRGYGGVHDQYLSSQKHTRKREILKRMDNTGRKPSLLRFYPNDLINEYIYVYMYIYIFIWLDHLGDIEAKTVYVLSPIYIYIYIYKRRYQVAVVQLQKKTNNWNIH